jgi:DNA-binding MarR family transcriptional regulator
MADDKKTKKNRATATGSDTFVNDDPDNVRLEKALVLSYIISEKIMVNSSHESGLSPVYAGIMYCSYWWKMKMQDIARMSGVTKSTVTHYVDYLEKKGFVRRVRDGEDRRDVFIQLTDQGRAWVETNHNKMERFLEQSETMYTKEEWQTLIRLLSRLVGGLETTPYEELLARAMKMEIK